MNKANICLENKDDTQHDKNKKNIENNEKKSKRLKAMQKR